MNERTVFLAAMEIESLDEREAYIERACGHDPALRQAVGDLFRAHDKQCQVLDGPRLWSTPPDESCLSEQVGSMIGPYKLREQIGEGGMGVVYVAEQKQPVRRKVALKIIKPGMDTQQVIARFEAERQALALMDHANIAKVFDAGATVSGRPYFVMELVAGVPITAYCDQARLSTRRRLALFVTVCRAVQHAHQKGIIHRDLKPGNILVTNHDAEPVAKVIDFGVAKAANQLLTERTIYTRLSEMIGTPMYMSPEQAEMSGLDVDTRCDVYSLGVLLFELLTGDTPFDRETLKDAGLDEMRRIIREDEPLRPSQRVSTLRGEALSTVSARRSCDPRRLSDALRGELDWIVIRALEKDRTRRYQSASALAADVERYLSDEPVQACPPSRRYRLAKFARRHKAALTAAALVATALLLGIVISSWQAWEANLARNLADQRLAVANHQRNLAQQATARSRELLYVADMKLAADALQAGDLPRVASLLERHQPVGGQPDLREFAWYYLRKAIDARPAVSAQHDTPIWCVRLSTDGTRLAAAGGNGRVYVYDSHTLDPQHTFLTSAGSVHAVAWSHDGRRLAAAAEDGRVTVWDFSTRAVELTIDAGQGAVKDIVFARDGRSLIGGDDRGKIHLWQASDGTPIRSWQAHGREIEQLALSPDGSQVATASSDRTAAVWQLDNGQRLLELAHGTERVVCVAYSPSGRQLAAGSISGHVMWADLANGQSQVLVRYVDGIESLTFMDNGDRLAIGDRGGALRLHPVPRQKSGPSPPVGRPAAHWLAHTERVQSVSVSPDGQRVVSSGRDGLVAGWQVGRSELRWPAGWTHDVALGPDDQLVCAKHAIFLRDLHTRRVTDFQAPTGVAWRQLAVAGNPRVLAAAGEQTVALFDVDQLEEVARWQVDEQVRELALSPDGHRLAVRWHQGSPTVHLFDTANPNAPQVLDALQCACLCFSPDSRYLAVGSQDDLLLFDLRTSRAPRRLKGHSSTLDGAAFSPDGRWLATVSHDRKLIVWDVASGDQRYSIVAHSDKASAVTYSPDGRTIATGDNNGVVRLWSADTGQPMLELSAVERRVVKLFLSSDTRQLVSQTRDGPSVVFDTRRPQGRGLEDETGACQFMTLGDLPGGRHYSEARDVSADGAVVAGLSAHKDGLRCFRWTETEGMRLLPSAEEPSDPRISGDGSQVLATVSHPSGRRRAACLSAHSQPAFRPLTGRNVHFRLRATDDTGKTFVGGYFKQDRQAAFVASGDGYQDLPAPPEATQSTAVAVSPDGRLVVGAAWKGSSGMASSENHDMTVVRWREGRLEMLPGFDDRAYNWAPWDASADGRVIVGARWPRGSAGPWAFDARPQARPFRWEDGQITLIDHPGGILAWVSSDGRVAVGDEWGPGAFGAFVWDPQHGIRAFQQVLASHGIYLSNWSLETCTGISADGTTLVGQAVALDGRREAYLLRVPRAEFFGE